MADSQKLVTKERKKEKNRGRKGKRTEGKAARKKKEETISLNTFGTTDAYNENTLNLKMFVDYRQ